MSRPREYLRAKEIAGLTGMSLRTIRRWIADEILPSVKLGGARLVATADLEAVLSASYDTFRGSSDDQEECQEES
jgi:excisionase family DNA binding protein